MPHRPNGRLAVIGKKKSACCHWAKPVLASVLRPKLQQLLRMWAMIEIESFVAAWRELIGFPPREYATLAPALVPKSLLGVPTVALVGRLAVDATLRQMYGFDLRKKRLFGEHLLSWASNEFGVQGQMQRAHEALIKQQLSDQLIGHIARDSIAIEVREKPIKLVKAGRPATPVVKHNRGCPRKAEIRRALTPTRLERLAEAMSLPAMITGLSRACDGASKTNSKVFKSTRVGYKLRVHVTDGQIPVSAALDSAGARESQVALPLPTLRAERKRNCLNLTCQ